MINIPNIEEFKQTYAKNLLLTNRYIVNFGPYIGGNTSTSSNAYKSTFNFTDTSTDNAVLSLKAKTITIPTQTYNVAQMPTPGTNAQVTSSWEPGQIDMEIYLFDGNELTYIDKWAKEHYNPATGTYGYFENYARLISVLQLDIENNIRLIYNFYQSTLYQFGSSNLNYEMSNEISTFQLSIKYRYFDVQSVKYKTKTNSYTFPKELPTRQKS